MSPKLPFWNSKFGFYQPYTAYNNRPGYREEKWHWSYSPLSRIYTSAYKRMIVIENLKGFAGDKFLPALNIIEEYVLGITPVI